MTTYYWRIDLYENEKCIKQGNIKYATEFQAEMTARGMSHIPHNIQIKIVKCQFEF